MKLAGSFRDHDLFVLDFSRESSSVGLVNVINVYYFKTKPSKDRKNVKYL